jgi:ribosomal protein S18 acetylase RimI-like enzyme
MESIIRHASPNDIDRLVELEQQCFQTDRISRKSFARFLKKGHCSILVDCLADTIRGYVLVLYKRGTSLSRLYSIAVDYHFRKQGVAENLVAAAEHEAIAHDTISMRLEIRQDNIASIRLFEKLGYKAFGEFAEYYEDGMKALRYEKFLASNLNPTISIVPYYQQTLEFTCGPAALLMAMCAKNPSIEFTRREELKIWRESTTIFMTSGHGGCSPYGLALSALKRGFNVEIYVNKSTTFLIDSVRNEDKKEVMKLVEQDFREELSLHQVPIYQQSVTADRLQQHYHDGGIAIALISSYRIYKEKFPHWVVVTGFDEHYIYIHDSYLADNDPQVANINMPILKTEFDRMARYGKSGQSAIVLIYSTED